MLQVLSQRAKVAEMVKSVIENPEFKELE